MTNNFRQCQTNFRQCQTKFPNTGVRKMFITIKTKSQMKKQTGSNIFDKRKKKNILYDPAIDLVRKITW